MADTRHPDHDDAHLEEERNALHTFERILEIMPDDRGALEAAVLAAHACGEREAAIGYRIRLADVLLESDEQDALQEQVDLLRLEDDLRARGWVEAYDLRQRAGGQPLDPGADEVEWTSGDAARSAFNIAEEIDLAWKLFEHREISQEEYSALVRDLTEMSAAQNGGTVSVLHALEAGHHKNQDRILSFLAQEAEETGIPYVSLSCFTMRAELARMLPEDFMVNRGAIVFETLGRERLVAVLNPFSQSLRADVQHLAGHPCHFYLARASEFDGAFARLKHASDASA